MLNVKWDVPSFQTKEMFKDSKNKIHFNNLMTFAYAIHFFVVFPNCGTKQWP